MVAITTITEASNMLHKELVIIDIIIHTYKIMPQILTLSPGSPGEPGDPDVPEGPGKPYRNIGEMS